MSVRVVVVLLILIAVLFVAGVCGGACSGEGDADRDLPGGIAESLSGFAVVPLDLDTVSTNCQVGNQLRLGFNQDCVLTAPKAGPATRRLKRVQGLMLIDGPDVGGEDGPQASPLPGKARSLDILGDGGQFKIHCSSAPCVLEPGR